MFSTPFPHFPGVPEIQTNKPKNITLNPLAREQKIYIHEFFNG